MTDPRTLSKQCKMLGEHGNYTAWIPAIYAKRGGVITIDMGFGEKHVYTITQVFDTVLSTDYLMERSADYRTQREASDI